MPLYAVNWHPAHFDASVFDERDSMLSVDLNAITPSGFNRLVAQGIRPAPEEPHGFAIDSRDSITLEPNTHISLCTYFNAFPAGYWRHWTRVKHLRFSARVSGAGTLTLFQSTARGLSAPVRTFTVHTESASDSTATPQDIESILSIKGMLDGGYYWLDAQADKNSTLTISHALWQVPVTDRRAAHAGTVSVAITTFNRPSYCLNQLRTIAHEEELRKHLDTIYCTDQGTDLVQTQDGFDEVSKDLGKQLTYIRQGNLGGSGGFSRGMYETVRAQKVTTRYCLMMMPSVSLNQSFVRYSLRTIPCARHWSAAVCSTSITAQYYMFRVSVSIPHQCGCTPHVGLSLTMISGQNHCQTAHHCTVFNSPISMVGGSVSFLLKPFKASVSVSPYLLSSMTSNMVYARKSTAYLP